MKTSTKFTVLALLILIMLALPMTGACISKKPKVSGTKWSCKQEYFVADAGTLTVIKTIHFVDNKKVKVVSSSSMPSHPATYVLPDGTVPIIEGHSSKTEENGTYKVKGSKIILEIEGKTTEISYMKDHLVVEKEGIFLKD